MQAVLHYAIVFKPFYISPYRIVSTKKGETATMMILEREEHKILNVKRYQVKELLKKLNKKGFAANIIWRRDNIELADITYSDAILYVTKSCTINHFSSIDPGNIIFGCDIPYNVDKYIIRPTENDQNQIDFNLWFEQTITPAHICRQLKRIADIVATYNVRYAWLNVECWAITCLEYYLMEKGVIAVYNSPYGLVRGITDPKLIWDGNSPLPGDISVPIVDDIPVDFSH